MHNARGRFMEKKIYKSIWWNTNIFICTYYAKFSDIFFLQKYFHLYLNDQLWKQLMLLLMVQSMCALCSLLYRRVNKYGWAQIIINAGENNNLKYIILSFVQIIFWLNACQRCLCVCVCVLLNKYFEFLTKLFAKL